MTEAGTMYSGIIGKGLEMEGNIERNNIAWFEFDRVEKNKNDTER
jgi:hypothetical protein